jgi:hypothetical protein
MYIYVCIMCTCVYIYIYTYIYIYLLGQDPEYEGGRTYDSWPSEPFEAP